MPFLIILCVFAVIGLIAYASHRYEKARTEEVRKVAADLGLPFSEEGFADIESNVLGLHLFERGRAKKFKNMMRGDTNDVDLSIFEYSYVTGGGKNRKTHVQSVVCIQSPQLQLPNFEMRPEGFFHKVGQAFGYKDIDFDSNPVFSERFLLRGENEDSIRHFFRPEILGFLEGFRDICVEGGRNRFVFYRTRKRVKPEEIRALMTEAFRVYKSFSTSSIAAS